jgi:hypothetical protein
MPTNFPVPRHPWLSVIEGPLFRQVLPGKTTDDELRAMLAEVERITLAMRSPFGWVTDVSSILHATPTQRRLYAESEKRLGEWDRRFCAGTGICSKDPLTRGIVTAVHWITPPAYPFKIYKRAEDAEAWARQQLVLRGVAISAGSSPPPVSSKRAAASI